MVSIARHASWFNLALSITKANGALVPALVPPRVRPGGAAAEPEICEDDDQELPYHEWPAWTDDQIWTITPDDGPAEDLAIDQVDDGSRLSLSEWIDAQADRFMAMGHSAAELVARELRHLAREARILQATDAETFDDRRAAMLAAC